MAAWKREGRDGSRKKVNEGLLVILLWFVTGYFWYLMSEFSCGSFFIYLFFPLFDVTESGFLQDESLQWQPIWSYPYRNPSTAKETDAHTYKTVSHQWFSDFPKHIFCFHQTQTRTYTQQDIFQTHQAGFHTFVSSNTYISVLTQTHTYTQPWQLLCWWLFIWSVIKVWPSPLHIFYSSVVQWPCFPRHQRLRGCN